MLRLKPLYDQIGRTLKTLQTFAPTDQVRLAIEKLTECQMEFRNICGSTMEIPRQSIEV